MNFNILGILPLLLDFQNKILNIVYKKDIAPHKINKGYKTIITAHTTLELKAGVNKKAQETTIAAKKILKKYLNDPQQLLRFIESKGTKVIAVKNIEKILRLIKEDEGFITPISGFKALILTIGLNILSPGCITIGFKTSEMFLIRNLNLNIFCLAHHFHHWIGYKKHLPGYDKESVKMFKNIWALDKTPGAYEKLSLDEILSLKDSIARDKEAIEFVKQFARENAGSKLALENIKDGKKVSV